MGSTNIHRLLNYRKLLSGVTLLLIVFLHSTLSAQQTIPKSLKLYPELEGHWFLDGQLQFGCEVTYTNGGKRRSAGYLQGNLLWSEFVCSSEQAIFDRDLCMVDLSAVARNGNALVINAAMKNYPQVKTSFTLRVPPMKEVRIMLPENTRIRYGRMIQPLITLEYNNGLSYSFKAGDANSLVPQDSLELFFNKEKIPPGAYRLPAYSPEMDRRFTLTVLWKSRPWLNDIESFVYEGRDDLTIRMAGSQGVEGKMQSKAPQAMDGAEGYYGQKGGDGLPVEIILRYDSIRGKLSVDVTADGKKVFKLLDPREASITLIVRGGKGGKGGRGGDGGDASLMEPLAAGVGGNGGVGGAGGKGSEVVIRCSKNAECYLPCLVIDNSGGEGGEGGKPGRGGKFSTGAVPTLLDLLFPSRNYPGNQGAMGETGEQGNEPEVILLD